jgi:hypothetical protein
MLVVTAFILFLALVAATAADHGGVVSDIVSVAFSSAVIYFSVSLVRGILQRRSRAS